jgi:hemerythrin-like domain-containing protein
MEKISDVLGRAHRECDDRFSLAEQAAGQGDFPECMQHFTAFRNSMVVHLSIEEDLLFPAFERRTGLESGATRVMRAEHQQMRALMEEMSRAAEAGEQERFLDLAEMLLIFLQQHNMKEENVLYPMLDDVLRADGRLVAETVQRSAPA